MIKNICCFVFAFECELSCVWLFATPWTTACQAPLSMGFSMEMGCHFLLQGNLPDLGIKSTSLASPALAVDSLPLRHLGKPPNASSSVQFSRSVASDSLRPHESEHTRPPCPSPTPRVYSNSCPLSRWCHPAISSSVVPFSSCPQSLPASGYFPMSQFFLWGGQSVGVSNASRYCQISKWG